MRTGAPIAHLGLVAVTLAAVMLVSPPASAADSDRDGLRDAFETRWGVTDAGVADSDGDGVVDPAEDNDGDGLGNLGEQRVDTDPGNPDGDGDGRPDGREDADGNGLSNALEQDRRPVPDGLRPSLEHAIGDIWARHLECAASPAETTLVRCRSGDAAAPTSVVVMGDSKAMMLMPAFSEAAREAGWSLVTLLKGSCTPILGTLNSQARALDGGRACRWWRARAIDWLADHPPSLIVLTHSDDYQLVDASGRVLSGGRKVRAWREGARRTLDAMPASSRVLLLGDVPRNAGNPVRCLKLHRDDMSACVTPRQSGPRRAVEKALRQAAGLSGRRFGSLHDQVCSYDPCPLVQGRTLMWRDGGHLTTTFARQLTPSVHALLAEALAEGP